MKPLTKNSRQAKIKLSTLFFATLLLSIQSCAQKNENETKTEQTIIQEKPDNSNVDYSKGSNIIENPAKLKGDEKKIFYHPFFLKLTHEEAKNLDPFKMKEEFEKLGITKTERARFVAACSFFITYYRGHKKSCENFAYFDFLKPKSKN